MAPHDVILLPKQLATSEQLSNALLTLASDRALSGDTTTTSAVLRVGQTMGPNAWRGHATRVSERVVTLLRSKAPTYVEGVGIAPNIDLYLPPHMLQGKLVHAAKSGQ